MSSAGRNCQTQPSWGRDKPLPASASFTVVSLVLAQEDSEKSIIWWKKGRKVAIRHLYRPGSHEAPPTHSQALLEGSCRDQERLESDSGLFSRFILWDLRREIEYLAWTWDHVKEWRFVFFESKKHFILGNVATSYSLFPLWSAEKGLGLSCSGWDEC